MPFYVISFDTLKHVPQHPVTVTGTEGTWDTEFSEPSCHTTWIPNTSPVLVLHTLGFTFESEPRFQRWSGHHFSYARGFDILPPEAEKGDVPWRMHWAGIVME